MSSLEPSQYDEMVADVRRALHRFLPGRNGDPKAGMAYTLLTTLMHTNEERMLHLGINTLDSAAQVSQCNRVIHDIYYTLVDTYVIKPGHPERERT